MESRNEPVPARVCARCQSPIRSIVDSDGVKWLEHEIPECTS